MRDGRPRPQVELAARPLSDRAPREVDVRVASPRTHPSNHVYECIVQLLSRLYVSSVLCRCWRSCCRHCGRKRRAWWWGSSLKLASRHMDGDFRRKKLSPRGCGAETDPQKLSPILPDLIHADTLALRLIEPEGMRAPKKAKAPSRGEASIERMKTSSR